MILRQAAVLALQNNAPVQDVAYDDLATRLQADGQVLLSPNP